MHLRAADSLADLALGQLIHEAQAEHLPLDFGASHALLSLYRAANAVRGHLTNSVLRPHDLTWTGFLVLWTLWIWDSMETREVAESVGRNVTHNSWLSPGDNPVPADGQ